MASICTIKSKDKIICSSNPSSLEIVFFDRRTIGFYAQQKNRFYDKKTTTFFTQPGSQAPSNVSQFVQALSCRLMNHVIYNYTVDLSQAVVKAEQILKMTNIYIHPK